MPVTVVQLMPATSDTADTVHGTPAAPTRALAWKSSVVLLPVEQPTTVAGPVRFTVGSMSTSTGTVSSLESPQSVTPDVAWRLTLKPEDHPPVFEQVRSTMDPDATAGCRHRHQNRQAVRRCFGAI